MPEGTGLQLQDGVVVQFSLRESVYLCRAWSGDGNQTRHFKTDRQTSRTVEKVARPAPDQGAQIGKQATQVVLRDATTQRENAQGAHACQFG